MLNGAFRSRLLFACSLSALALTLACGGSSAASSTSASSTPPPTPKPVAKDASPFWTSDAPIRPSVAPLFAHASATGPIISLNALEAAQVAAAPELPSVSHLATVVAPTTGPQLRIVVGLQSSAYHLDSTTTLQPTNLTLSVIEALVPNTSGGFDTLPGVGHSDGTFSIQNVPVGYYWLHFGTTYLWTNSNYVDWSFDQFGRPDGVYPSISPTNLSLSLTSLNAWQGSDELVWDVPNQGNALSLPLTSADITNAPTLGATALSGFTMNFLGGTDLYFPLLDASKGDQAYLDQLTTRTAAGESYRALAKTYVAPATTMTDGVATNLSGGFLDIPQTSTLRLNWQRSAFVALAPSVNPSAAAGFNYLFTYAFPLPSSYGLPFNAFQLLDYTSTGTGDLDLGNLSYGNPFPSSWSAAVETYQEFNVSYLAPGATTPVVLTRYTYQSTTTLPTATTPITPLIGPVQNPKINGKDLFSNQISVGTNPTISWSGPAVGSASGYVITCYRLSASGSSSGLQRKGSFRTRTTSITLPNGIMTAGNTYVITIAAIRANGVDFNSTPFKTALPYGFTSSMSAIVAP